MTTGVRKNPKTGQLETYDLPPPADLERSRKEFRDFVHGNYQWHDDPNKAPPPPPPPPTTTPDPDDPQEEQPWWKHLGEAY